MAYFECMIGGASGDGVALIVECDSDFAGSVITADNGEDSFSDTCPSVAPYTVKFDGIPTGTYTISGVSGGVTITKQYTVLDYTASLHAIPNGSTVTPVNDIQIWLHCADIYDKNYTTLDEVLEDASTLQALIASNNAADYMARSTAFADSIIPIMTSDTTPSGHATASGAYGGAAYLAFDRNDTTAWTPLAGTTSQSGSSWLQYEFANEVEIGGLKWVSGNASESDKEYPYVMTIEVSADGTTFTPIHTFTQTQSNITPEMHTVILDNIVSARYIKITYDRRNVKASNTYYYGRLASFEVFGAKQTEVIPKDANAMSYIGANDYCASKLLANSTWCDAICNSAYFESVLNVKVPTMTSNNTPSGECFGSSAYATSFYQAFDGNTNSGCLTNDSSNAYIGYGFTSGVKVYLAKFVNYRYDTATSSPRVKNFKIQASNLKTSGYVDLASGQYPQNDLNYIQKSILNPATTYNYYRLFIIDSWAGSGYVIGAKDIQFYGRA